MKRFKKIGSVAWKTGLIALITLLLFEIAYRYQWIDFYKVEWNYHTKELPKIESPNQRILVLGDSFSADKNSWVYELATDSTLQVFNASLPGVGPETFRLIAKDRIHETNPTVIILQLYVGNDLYDIHKPISWSKFSFGRNLFWSISNNIRSLNFLNYRIGQMSVEDELSYQPKQDTIFDPKRFSPRDKLFINGNSNYPENVICVLNEQSKSFNKLLDYIEEVKGLTPKNCTFNVLLVPHSCQVNERYVQRYKKLGAKLNDDVLKNTYWVDEIRKKGIETIDLIEVLNKHEEVGIEMFYTNDIHLNPDGQRVVGKFVKSQM